jgi:hypothetical protein
MVAEGELGGCILATQKTQQQQKTQKIVIYNIS